MGEPRREKERQQHPQPLQPLQPETPNKVGEGEGEEEEVKVMEGLRQRHLPPTRTSPQGGAAKEVVAAVAAVPMEALPKLLVESRPSAHCLSHCLPHM